MNKLITIVLLLTGSISLAQFPPAVNQNGTTAIAKDSSVIVNWATTVVEINRGPQDISNPGMMADFGFPENALGVAEGNSTDVVSLGDGGSITLRFDFPIMNGAGPDFAVFENGFDHEFLELAHVEVSSDGLHFVRIPSESLTQTDTQTSGFGSTDPTKIHNLAGKYIQGFGTPFDLEDVADSSGINLDSVLYVRIVDVIGSISPTYGSVDGVGNYINDPFPTSFDSGGFDLDGIAVIHENNIYASINQDQKGFKVYPNPSADYVKVYGNGKLEIYDLNGRQLYEEVMFENLSLSLKQIGLTPGIYLMKLDNQIKKIVLK